MQLCCTRRGLKLGFQETAQFPLADRVGEAQGSGPAALCCTETHARYSLTPYSVLRSGPVECALPYFEEQVGFACPVRKDHASFLQVRTLCCAVLC